MASNAQKVIHNEAQDNSQQQQGNPAQQRGSEPSERRHPSGPVTQTRKGENQKGAGQFGGVAERMGKGNETLSNAAREALENQGGKQGGGGQ